MRSLGYGVAEDSLAEAPLLNGQEPFQQEDFWSNRQLTAESYSRPVEGPLSGEMIANVAPLPEAEGLQRFAPPRQDFNLPRHFFPLPFDFAIPKHGYK